jgi:hypothetical protein
MFRFIFWAIVFYLAFRFIFNFVIPVFRATRQMKAQMRDFKEKMEGQQRPSENNFQQPQRPSPQEVRKEDYIDFEEIK